jgi:hypothetical protein
MPDQDSVSEKWKKHAGILFKPKNLLKTVAGQVPVASIATSLVEQIEDYETDLRIGKLEAEVAAFEALKSEKQEATKIALPLNDWSVPAGEYIRRTIDIIVAYDSGFHAGINPGKELYQAVGHGCIFAEKEVLTCKEALEMAQAVAAHKNGRVMITCGPAWYECDFSEADKNTGLCIGQITKRDEKKWEEFSKLWVNNNLGTLPGGLPSGDLAFSFVPWIGQEIGFFHSGEAENVMRGSAFLKFQFDTGTISHFRRPTSDGLKIFVSGVLGGRVLQAGSPVFGRDGRLLGILSDTESYQSDAGRRAVGRSLLGHPRFSPKEK